MTVWDRRGKTPEGLCERMTVPAALVVAYPHPALNCHCKKKNLKKREKEKKVKLIHFNIFCLGAFLLLRGHVSQNAFTAFPITTENKTGDGTKVCDGNTHTAWVCVCACVGGWMSWWRCVLAASLVLYLVFFSCIQAQYLDTVLYKTALY